MYKSWIIGSVIWGLMAVMLVGCKSESKDVVGDADISALTITTISQAESFGEDTSTSTKTTVNPNDAVGGQSEIYHYIPKFDGGHNTVGKYISDQPGFNVHFATLDNQIKVNKYNIDGWSIYELVRQFNVSYDKFMECNTKDKSFAFLDETQYFSDEEIHDIYNLSLKEFREKYAHPSAVVQDGVIYPAAWFAEYPASDWVAHQFAVAELQEKLNYCKTEMNFSASTIAAYEKNLADYIALLAEQE